MARQIPSNQKFLTVTGNVDTTERSNKKVQDDNEYYSIADLILTTGGGEGGNAGTLAESITVTNPDGAYEHLSSIYSESLIPAGTSIETLLRNILNPYISETVTLSSLSVAIYTPSNSSWGSYNNVTSLNLEAGQSFRVRGVTKSVSDEENILDDSLVLYNGGGGVLVDNISDTSGLFIFLDGPQTTDNSIAVGVNGEVHAFRLSATDIGYGSSPIFSTYRYITFHNRVRAGGSTELAVNSNNASNLISELHSYNQLRGRADIPFEGDSYTDNEDNYTWITYPASWGTASDIELGSFGVLDDFEDVVVVPVTNDHGHTAYYNFYRSTGKGVFGVGQNITLTFS